MRFVLGLLGLAALGYGAWVLLGLGTDNLIATGQWLVGGVIVHDAVLAPVTVLLGVLVARRVGRSRFAARLSTAAIVLATVTVVAVPVLLHRGARADNPTLLDRSYGTGWLVVLGVTVLVTAAAMLVDRQRSRHAGARTEED